MSFSNIMSSFEVLFGKIKIIHNISIAVFFLMLLGYFFHIIFFVFGIISLAFIIMYTMEKKEVNTKEIKKEEQEVKEAEFKTVNG
jgi:predicted membrane protein